MKPANGTSPERRLLPLLKSFWLGGIERHFEALFILSILVSIGTITYLFPNKLAFLNFYFIPVLMAAYFLNLRSAVLGSVLSILWVALSVAVWPEAFLMEPGRLGVGLHVVVWGSFLVLCGVLVGRLNEQVLERYARMREVLEDWKSAQGELHLSNVKLEDRNRSLDALRGKLEAVLYATMDPVVARMVVNRQLVNEKREITVLFADLVGFTTTAEELRPEVVVNEMNRLFTQMEPVIAAYRGHLDKYVGDGLMAEFGIPILTRQNAVQAALAALKMQERMSRRDFRWKMRIGLSHGNALVGLIGSEHRKNYTALGDIVNLASRLQEVCPAGSVCVDGATHDLIGRWFHSRKLANGRSAEEAGGLEQRLRSLKERIRSGPRGGDLFLLDAYLEAAKLSAELGDVRQSVEFYRSAIRLNPAQKARVEALLAKAVLEHDADGDIAIKGKLRRVAAYELLGLKDPFEDAERIPPHFHAAFDGLLKAEGLDRDALLPLEAVDGTLGHSQGTAALAQALAYAMGLPDDEIRAAFLAGFFHDAGKRSVPEPVLTHLDRGSLPEADLRLYQSHPAAARDAVKLLGADLPEEALAAIAQHHERFDGGGYPAGLKGADISLCARIVHAVDEYDALTSWRASREAWDPGAALEEMAADAENGKLDCKVVEAFRRMMEAARPSNGNGARA